MTMTDTAFKVGDKVLVEGASYGGVWTIVKKNPKTYGLTQGHRRLRASAEYLRHAPEGAEASVAVATLVPIREMPVQPEGGVVRYTGRDNKDLRKGMLLCVIADKYEKVNVAPIGGLPNGGYYRMPWRMLEAVDPATWAVVED